MPRAARAHGQTVLRAQPPLERLLDELEEQPSRDHRDDEERSRPVDVVSDTGFAEQVRDLGDDQLVHEVKGEGDLAQPAAI